MGVVEGSSQKKLLLMEILVALRVIFFLKEALGDLYLNGKIPGSGPNQLCQLQLAQNIGKIRKKKNMYTLYIKKKYVHEEMAFFLILW
jgi:hypothetical protein